MTDTALSGLCRINGSEGCPCVLASLKECLVCSHLQGLDFCDCRWTKNCVYIDYIHDKKNYKAALDGSLAPALFLAVGIRGYHVFLTASGSVLNIVGPLDCVTVTAGEKPEGAFPAVVLEKYPDHGILSLAVSTLTATRRKRLLSSRSFELIPGLKTAVQGLENPERVAGRNVLVIAGDFGQLLAPALVKRLQLNNAKEITVLLDENLPFITGKLARAGVRYQAGNGRSLTKALQTGGLQACYSLGPNWQHKSAAMALFSAGSAIPLFISTGCKTNAF